MCDFTELLAPTKSEKCGALTCHPASDNEVSPVAGVLTVTGKRCHCSYRVEEFPADFGRGFVLRKLAAGSDKTEGHYSCLIGASAKLCECKGFVSTGGCKHVAALVTLI